MTLDRDDIQAIAEQMAPMLARMLGAVAPDSACEPSGIEVYRLRQMARDDLEASKARAAAKRLARRNGIV